MLCFPPTGWYSDYVSLSSSFIGLLKRMCPLSLILTPDVNLGTVDFLPLTSRFGLGFFFLDIVEGLSPS